MTAPRENAPLSAAIYGLMLDLVSPAGIPAARLLRLADHLAALASLRPTEAALWQDAAVMLRHAARQAPAAQRFAHLSPEALRARGAALKPACSPWGSPSWAVFRNIPPAFARADNAAEARRLALEATQAEPGSFFTVAMPTETHRLAVYWPDPEFDH